MTLPAEIVHATTVSIEGHGVLIIGPSCSGKSSLALQLIALGADLVADDRTQVTREGAAVIATVPDTICGIIEARGVGLISMRHAGPTPLALVVDLSQTEKQRLPEVHHQPVAGLPVRCLHATSGAHFASAIWLYVRGGLDTSL